MNAHLTRIQSFFTMALNLVFWYNTIVLKDNTAPLNTHCLINKKKYCFYVLSNDCHRINAKISRMLFTIWAICITLACDRKRAKIIMACSQVRQFIAALLLAVIGLSSIYAANDAFNKPSYDFNKLSMLANQRYGQAAQQNIQQLHQLIQSLQTASELEKLQQVNDFFNQKIQFTDDLSLWGKTDYWATPLETIGRQAGDCEDFTIAKYVFLKALNIDNNRLRLTYVRAKIFNDGNQSAIAHMVLSYYQTPQSEPLILDNLTPEILPASSRTDLSPIFSFNDKGLWVGASSKPKGEAQTNLSRWRDVLLRTHADGIE